MGVNMLRKGNPFQNHKGDRRRMQQAEYKPGRRREFHVPPDPGLEVFVKGVVNFRRGKPFTTRFLEVIEQHPRDAVRLQIGK